MILIFAAIKIFFKKALKIVRVEIFEKDTWQHFLRGLPLSYVICFVSQEVKLYDKAYESTKAIVNSVCELAIAF